MFSKKKKKKNAATKALMSGGYKRSYTLKKYAAKSYSFAKVCIHHQAINGYKNDRIAIMVQLFLQ